MTSTTDADHRSAEAPDAGDPFRLLAASSPVGLVLTDERGNAVWVNDRWRQITGSVAPVPISFARLEAFVHPEDRPDTATVLAEAARRRGEFATETRIARPDGEVRHVRLQGAPMVDAAGGLMGYAGTLVDVTDLMDATTRLIASERRERNLLENAPIGQVLFSLDGTILEANEAWCRMLGYQPDEVVGMSASSFLHPDHVASARNLARELAVGRSAAFEQERRLLRKDGGTVWVLSTITLERGEHGEPSHFHSLVADITERKDAELSLRRSENRYRKLLDEAPVGQVVSELDGRLIEVNRAFLELIGGTLDELLDLPPESLFHPDDLPELARLTDRLVRGEIESFQTERRLRRPDGGVVWVAGGTSLLRDGDDVVLHSIVHDITEQKVAERLLRESEGRHRDVVEALHDAILVVGPDGLEAVNRAALELFNLPFEDLARSETWEALDPVDRDGKPIPLHERAPIVAMRERRPVSDVISALDIPGRGRRWFDTNALPRIRDGEVIGAVITFSDVTERELATEALRESESRFRTLAESLPVGVYRADPVGRLTYVNPRWCEITGIDERRAVGHQTLDLVHPDDAAEVVRRFSRSLAGSGAYRAQHRIVTARGDVCWVNANGTPIVDDDTGQVTGFIGSLEDVTPLIHAQDETTRLAGIVEATSDLVGIADARTERLVYLNRAGRELFGYVDRSVREVELEAIYPPESLERVERDVYPVLARGEAWSGELAMTAADGTVRHVWQTITATLDPAGALVELSAVGRDVTERRRFEAELAHQATHDALTDLPNRALLLDHLELALARAERDRTLVALLFLDLDRFKLVNDSRGHDAGDELLVQTAQRIAEVVRPVDTVARLGGDEFVVLCEDVEDEHHALAIAQRVSRAIESRPFVIDHVEVAITASVGIAVSTGGEACHPEALLRDSDAAMYRAKDAGRARLELFDESMRRRSAARIHLAHELTEAIEQGHIVVYYQPCVDLRTGRVSSVEALARWAHPRRGILSPGEFIGLAEETGLVIGLGLRVLSDACHQAREWELTLGPDAPRVHVNLSARQLVVPNIAVLVRGVLEGTGLDPALLCLEITESVVMDDASAVIDTLRQLKDIGVSIAIDDFGTGYSSLSYLRRFPVDVLKVDRSFVDGLGPDPEDSAIVAAVIGLARTLDLQAVAEGVETAEQLDALVRLGCDAAQGYWFARPDEGGKVTSLLTSAFAVPAFPEPPAHVR